MLGSLCGHVDIGIKNSLFELDLHMLHCVGKGMLIYKYMYLWASGVLTQTDKGICRYLFILGVCIIFKLFPKSAIRKKYANGFDSGQA